MTNTLLTFGSSIQSAADSLQRITLEQVAHLVQTDEELRHTTERLRKLCTLDSQAYKVAKTRLPYVVGSTFMQQENGSYIRRTETFVEANYFILDIDNCQTAYEQVPASIQEDISVALAFISPGGRGIKVFCPLLEPCTDARQFSAAYRQFATDFGSRHRFTRSLDLRTCDVTRACFLAHDPHAFVNLQAICTDWRIWWEEAQELELPLLNKEAKPKEPKRIDEEGYLKVLKEVNPRSSAPVRRERQVEVPEALLALEADVRPICQRLGWEVTRIDKLNYGLKFVVRAGYRTAEVNVFYGKKGFSIVRSPKTGTDITLAERLYDQLYTLLFPSVVVDVSLVQMPSLN